MPKTRAELLRIIETAHDEIELACRELAPPEWRDNSAPRCVVNARQMLREVQVMMNDLEDEDPKGEAFRESRTNLRIVQAGFARAFFEKTGCKPLEAELCEEKSLDKEGKKVTVRWFFRRQKP